MTQSNQIAHSEEDHTNGCSARCTDYKELYDAALQLYMELLDSHLRQKQERWDDIQDARQLADSAVRTAEACKELALKRDNELVALLNKKDVEWGRDKEFLLKETRRLESELDSAREVKETFAIEANRLRAELELERSRTQRSDDAWAQVKKYVVENQDALSYFQPQQWANVMKKFRHLSRLLINAVQLDRCHE